MSPFLACGFLEFHQDGGFTLRIRISCFGSWKANWALERAGRHLSLLQASLPALPGSIFKIMMPTEIIWGIFSAVVGVGVGQWARTQALELYKHGPEFQFSDSLVANSWLGFTSLILCFPAKWRWLDRVLCCLSFLSPYDVPGIQGGNMLYLSQSPQRTGCWLYCYYFHWQMMKLRLEETRWLISGHPATKWQAESSSPGCLIPKFRLLTSFPWWVTD